MARISKAEQSRTHQIDEAMESVSSLLSGMRVIRALGAQPGKYIDILSNMYPPNVRHGVRSKQSVTILETPKDYQNDTSIALFMANSGEVLVPSAGMMTMHRDQLNVVRDITPLDDQEGVLHDAIMGIDDAIDAAKPFLLPMRDSKETGRQVTITVDAKVTIGGLPRTVRGRPAIYLPRATGFTRESVGLMLFHQIAHADHALHDIPQISTMPSSDRRDEEDIRDLENKVAIARHWYKNRQG